ncbi:nitrate- and nitrite sensing domain-containing protein [Streptomyces sp. VRA16 Mangrove soil]|uniref:sensor histidine kinase n=1 Tax=Streptomyces sp. VRA16 Mangrove soil TaxID=2817434 RepID=UPI001A9F30A7|nr:nitrate- and nitrite sensing domain-containing protein [Streptomyces sp. VRA16 Mangrove soil]MBO1335879.1 nitrate- and nitrite sensing domain-containing protein [Streptomyces sp. VRA16 Mangrove soil]
MQGRKNRDGSAAAEPEPRGGTGPIAGGSQPSHAQNPGRTASVDLGERETRSATQGGAPTPAQPQTKAKSPSGPGSRIALRNWRISTRLVSLLALPVVAATSLGALRIAESLDDIQQLDNMKLLTEMTKQATELASALQTERDQSAGPLANDPKAASTNYDVKTARKETDRARTAFLDATYSVEGDDESSLKGVREHVVQIARQLIDLKDIRSDAYAKGAPTSQTVEAYSRIIENLLSLSTDMAQATSSPEMIDRTRSLAAFSSAKEYASQQRAIIAAALPENSKTFGSLTDTDRLYGEAAFEDQDNALDSFRNVYGTVPAEELLKPLTDNNATIKAADNYADRVFKRTDGIRTQDKRSYKDWYDADTQRITQMTTIETTLLNEMEQQARELRSASERQAIINGALILLVLGVSLVGAFVVARSMIRSLRRLQDTATKVAQERLPELVKELSESDPQDVDTSVESVGVHSRDEIGQVAAAFDDVHREAVRLAAEQALLRGNVNAMFTNLSRRSQGLIQRQLSLISELESREADPDQLSSLFKLDHLATRMRRNGENLLVLAGEEPGRRWTRPVPLVDVLRAAASEVEQYERIELAAVPATDVAGRVVNDLVHLLAELLENATSFSSPQTKVKVTGHALPDGRVLIEIHDTGIGLSPEDLAAINERLASPPTVDVSVSRRMGLFVVGRLSQRHGIRIQLRPSDSGGTTALVMLPVDVAQGKKLPGKPGAPGGSGGPAAAQAAAGVAAARRGVGAGGQGGQGGPGGPGGGGGGAGRLGAGPGATRPQVGAGQSGPRAALPARDGGPQAQPPMGAPQRPQAPQPARAQQNDPQQSTGLFNAPGPVPPQQRTHSAPGDQRQIQGQGGRPVLPPRGGPRAELPGGNPQPRVPSWSDENAQPNLDAPRGHEETDSVESTAQFPQIRDEQQRPGQGFGQGQAQGFGQGQAQGFGQGRPQDQDQGTGQFVRSDVFGGAPSSGGPNGGAPNGGLPNAGVPNGGVPHGVPQNGGAPGANGASFGGGQGQDFSAGGQDFGGFRDNGLPGLPARQDQSSSTGQFERPQNPVTSTGQFERPQDPATTGQFERPAAPRQRGDFGTQDFGAPLPGGQGQNGRPNQFGQGNQFDQGIPAQPAQQGYLPPADQPGDGRTPLYDTLETNWFHGQQQDRQQQSQEPQQPQAPQSQGQQLPQRGAQQPAAPAQPQAPAMPQRPRARAQEAAPAAPTASQDPANWRQSPNDELMRQAERVRKPAAGGVTVSGLPRRVPRANLVAGTAQEQQHQAGPQVSRAPDDVRGRLTNLRRGIQQGRQAGGTGNTGSYPRPTHQQER